jgi:hypothetical protein
MGAVVDPERELLRAPRRPALLRRRRRVPEGPEPSAAMDSFNADRHLFGGMPEQWSVLLPLPRAEPPPFCFTVFPAVHRNSQAPR